MKVWMVERVFRGPGANGFLVKLPVQVFESESDANRWVADTEKVLEGLLGKRLSAEPGAMTCGGLLNLIGIAGIGHTVAGADVTGPILVAEKPSLILVKN